MAFIIPLLPSSSSHTSPFHHRILPCSHPRSRPRWISLARSHPYGNGGIPTELDYTGFDLDATRKRFAELDRQLATNAPPPQRMSNWVLVLSADIIQWNNNLFHTSIANGYSWDLRGIKVVHMAEQTARRSIIDRMTALYAVEMGQASDELLAVRVERRGDDVEEYHLILAFEGEDEVGRFAELLKAEGHTAKEKLVAVDELDRECEQRGVLVGVVPSRAFISPMQFDSVTI